VTDPEILRFFPTVGCQGVLAARGLSRKKPLKMVVDFSVAGMDVY
jgi:hypothetical protein